MPFDPRLPLTRRRAVLALSAFGLSVGFPSLSAAIGEGQTLTPRQSSGPFYPDPLPSETDWDLTALAAKAGRQAEGDISLLEGVVREAGGAPLPGAAVEIWQCDARGFYHHPLDRPGERDLAFQSYGRATTGESGAYRFRTIRPVSYPGRTPHIHMRVTAPGRPPLTTQLYVAGERLNGRDFLYNRIPRDLRSLVTADFKKDATPDHQYRAQFDLFVA